MELLWVVLVVAVVWCAFSLSKIGAQLERIAYSLRQQQVKDKP